MTESTHRARSFMGRQLLLIVRFFERKEWPRAVVALAILAAALLYIFAQALFRPYAGLSLSVDWAVEKVEACEVHPGWCDNFQPALLPGDRLLRIGETPVEVFDENQALVPFAEYAPGEPFPLEVQRGEKIFRTNWSLAAPDASHLSSIWLGLALVLPFWLVATLTLFNVRPRDARWRLLIALNYALAIWTSAGFASQSGVLGSRLLFRSIAWLLVPFLLHLHYVTPRPLLRRTPALVWPSVHAFGTVMAILEALQLLPTGLVFGAMAFGFSVGVSVLIYRSAARGREGFANRLMLLGLLAGFGPGFVLWVLPYLLPVGAQNALSDSLGVLVLPLFPIAYAVAVFRWRPGGIELRISPVLGELMYAILGLGIYTGLFLALTSDIESKSAILAIGSLLGILSLSIAPAAHRAYWGWLRKRIHAARLSYHGLLADFGAAIAGAADLGPASEFLRTALEERFLIRESVLCRCTAGADDTPLRIGDHRLTAEQMSFLREHWGQVSSGYLENGIEQVSGLDWVRLVLPIHMKDGLGAVWLFGRRDPDDFYSKADIEILKTLARQIAVLLDSQQLEIDLQMESERRGRAESLARLQAAALESTAYAIMITDAKAAITWVNPAFTQLTGYLAEEIIGQTPKVLTSEEAPEKAYSEIWESLRSGRSWRGEFEVRRKDAQRLIAMGTFTPVRGAGQQVEHYVAILQDITEQAKEQEEITRLKEFNEGIVQTVKEGLLIDDLKGVIRFANPELESLLGYFPHELVGKHWREIFPEDQVPIIEEENRKRRQGASSSYEAEVLHKDGSRIPALISGSPLSPNGQFLGTVAAVTDIRKIKEAQRELLRMKEFNESIVQSMDEGIVILDADGHFTFVNPAAARLLGYSVDEMIGMHWSETVDPRWHSLVEDVDRRRAEGVSDRYELRLIRKDGDPVDVIVSGSPRSEEGAFSGTMAVFIDITERKKAEAKVQTQVKRLSALHSIDMAISGSLDLRITLDVLLDQVIDQLDVDAAAVLMLDEASGSLEFVAGRGFFTQALQHTHLRLGEGFAGEAALKRRMIRVADLREDPGGLTRSARFAEEGFVSYVGIPLIAKGEVKGVLEIYQRRPVSPDTEWLEFLGTLATQAAIAIDNASLFGELQRSHNELSLAYDETLEGWTRALDLRDKETEGHTRRVTDLTLRLAQQAGIDGDRLVHIGRGALLHDIGKMGIPDSILLKPGPLSDEEWVIMRKHPVYAYEMLSPIEYLRPALEIPYCHHERWDGGGYPRGLAGEAIPLEARVFSIVDVWDALNSDRPYRKAWPREKVLDYIEEQRGTQFDPAIVDVFLKLES